MRPSPIESNLLKNKFYNIIPVPKLSKKEESPMKPEVEENSPEEHGIFKHGKVRKQVFEREVKKYRPGGLDQKQRAAL